jgi:tRNA-dihydrouridine synthase B
MKIGAVALDPPFGVAPMAGMTDTAFRRLVKRHGGCGLVVTEMVSSEGLVRGIDRTLEYAEYTEEERPVSIQIFGGDPAKMAAAAQVVEGMGADLVDVNMGRVQPDARAGARRVDRRGDGPCREDPRHREDAGRLERPAGERA